jgi:hypothetical protein
MFYYIGTSDYWKSYETTTLWVFCNFQYIAAAIAFAIGRPFRKEIWHNCTTTTRRPTKRHDQRHPTLINVLIDYWRRLVEPECPRFARGGQLGAAAATRVAPRRALPGTSFSLFPLPPRAVMLTAHPHAQEDLKTDFKIKLYFMALGCMVTQVLSCTERVAFFFAHTHEHSPQTCVVRVCQVLYEAFITMGPFAWIMRRISRGLNLRKKHRLRN